MSPADLGWFSEDDFSSAEEILAWRSENSFKARSWRDLSSSATRA